MVTRRELFKSGGAAALGGMTAAALGPTTASASDRLSRDGALSDVGVALNRVGRHGRGAPGPLYWSTYGYSNEMNVNIPEAVWKTNIDWVANTFKPYGYTMVCTDGWVDLTQRVTTHGYMRSLADDWVHDWAYWGRYVAEQGLELGVYYHPLWATKSAVHDPSVTVVGRPDIKVGDIVNEGDYLNSGGNLYWVDVTKDGAEEYVKGNVEYYKNVGAVFLRLDFLAWYETGFDQNDGTVSLSHGRDGYLTSLRWIREAAGDEVQVSLVMPNLFDHGSAEREYGDLIRIDNDVSFGTWYNLSLGRQTWQPIWSQWNNPFLGFTGFSDLSGRGQLILDGDPIIISSFSTDAERQTAVNLFTMAGAAIAITDRHDTIGPNAPFFTNQEVLDVRSSGLVGKPVYKNTHDFSYDQSSRDPERWIGQLGDGSWVIGLFNRSDGPAPSTKSIDFVTELGLSAPASVRDLWAHQDLGTMTAFRATLDPHASVLVKVDTAESPHFAAEVGGWEGTARFDNVFGGFEGLGYVTGLDTQGSALTLSIRAKSSGVHGLSAHVANATGSAATLSVSATDLANGRHVGAAKLSVPSTAHWTEWQHARCRSPWLPATIWSR